MSDLLTVENLSVSFRTDEGIVRAVGDVSFSVKPGEVLGIVGESGCGKTVTAMSILRLIPAPPGKIDGGRILFQGADLLKMPIEELRGVRGRKISMIFQEPMTALSPLMAVGNQLTETLLLHEPVSKADAWRKGEEWLAKVGMGDPAAAMRKFPYELSGGMRQRVMIAMALMLSPDLVIADEPTTALDVTIQAQVFELMLKMKGNKTSLIFITHDMGVIWELCDRVIVMYASHVVEEGAVRQIFKQPLHPYTKGLLAAMPRLQREGRRLHSIPGQVPSPLNYPKGCHFADRCPFVHDRCRQAEPPLFDGGNEQKAACYLVDENGK